MGRQSARGAIWLFGLLGTVEAARTPDALASPPVGAQAAPPSPPGRAGSALKAPPAGAPAASPPAQEPPFRERGPEEELSATRELLGADAAAVELGRLGQAKARSPGVRELAGRLVRDRRATSELMQSYLRQRASAQGITGRGDSAPGDTPTATAAQPTQLAALRRLEGREFDDRFAAAVLQSTRGDLSKVSNALDVARDPALRELLAQVLEVLQAHRRMAEELMRTGTVAPL